MLNNEYLSYIYKKFSKIFRLDLKDNESEENIKKSFKIFSRLFDIWKIMLNYDEYLKNNEKYLLFLGKNSINMKINDINEKYTSMTILINLIKFPLLKINNNLEDLVLLKIYNKNGESIDIKIEDVFKGSDVNLSKINLIKFNFVINRR